MIEELKYRKVDLQRDAAALLNYVKASEFYHHEFLPSQFKSVQDFEGYLKSKLKFFFHDFYIITTRDGTPVGFAYAFDYRVYDGHCKICVKAMNDQYDKKVSEWIEQFCSILFRSYPLHKLFFSALASEESYIDVYLRAGFTQECELPEYVFYHGRYQDLLVFGKEREQMIDD